MGPQKINESGSGSGQTQLTFDPWPSLPKAITYTIYQRSNVIYWKCHETPKQNITIYSKVQITLSANQEASSWHAYIINQYQYSNCGRSPWLQWPLFLIQALYQWQHSASRAINQFRRMAMPCFLNFKFFFALRRAYKIIFQKISVLYQQEGHIY